MELRDSIVINAPLERVWEVFADVGSYPEWNPFLRRFDGPLESGRRVAVELDMGLFRMPIRPFLTVVDAPRELSWQVEQGSSFLYTVRRHFRFDSVGGDRTHFVQSEESEGFLAPVIDLFLFIPVQRGYRAFNRALKVRAEKS